MGKREVWRHGGILAGRGTVHYLSPDCSLNGRLKEVILGGRLGRSNSDSDPGFVAGREWSQQPHIPRKGNCSVPEGGEQSFGKRERSRPGQKLESQNPESERKEDQNLWN